MRQAGFADVREFVNYVLSNVDAVYAGRENTYSFVTRGERHDGRVLAELGVVEERGSYRITTAHAIRADFFKKKGTPLWERAQSSRSTEGTPRAISGQSGERLNFTKDSDSVKPYLQNKATSARGGIRQLDDGRYIVGLFKNRDASTVLHETGHFFLENLREAAGLETAPQWVKDSWAALQKEYGFDSGVRGEAWTRAHERFAREFEAYAREGVAPSPELAGAFIL